MAKPLQLLPDNKGIFGVDMRRLWGEAGLLLRESFGKVGLSP